MSVIDTCRYVVKHDRNRKLERGESPAKQANSAIACHVTPFSLLCFRMFFRPLFNGRLLMYHQHT
jgi:hypothetical protein